eukprot:303195-Rhodomonas_salina.1
MRGDPQRTWTSRGMRSLSKKNMSRRSPNLAFRSAAADTRLDWDGPVKEPVVHDVEDARLHHASLFPALRDFLAPACPASAAPPSISGTRLMRAIRVGAEQAERKEEAPRGGDATWATSP